MNYGYKFHEFCLVKKKNCNTTAMTTREANITHTQSKISIILQVSQIKTNSAYFEQANTRRSETQMKKQNKTKKLIKNKIEWQREWTVFLTSIMCGAI